MQHRQSTAERIGRAIHSSDLGHDARRTTDADVLAALGGAGIKHRHGAAILQLDMTLRADDLRDAEREAKGIARDVAWRNGWAIPSPKDLSAIARQALEHYVSPACPHCLGRGMLYEAGQSVRACLKCDATGRKPLRTRFEREVRAVLAAFDRLREATIAGVNFRLGRPVAA